MAGQPTVIYSAANTQQAYLLRGLLEEQGITASVVNDALQVAGGELPLGWTTAPRVVVAESDAVQARALAEQFDHQTAHKLTVDDSPEAEPLAEWLDWPVCPQCGQRRSARCPVCGISRTDFPLAEVQDGAGEQQVLLKCEDCDDLIQPQWYRLCAACGYDFGNGIQVDDVSAQDIATSRSLVAIVIALAAGALALAAYFTWLFTGRVV
jgi:hypothetical protein